TDRHIKYVFGGVAIAGMIGYLTMSLSVKEGEYPPVVEKTWPQSGLARLTFFRVCFNFTAESFTAPLYWWIYVTRLCIYAAQAVSGAFLIFFGQKELGLDLAHTDSTLAAWPAILWIVLAYPIGRLLDRRGPIPVLTVALTSMTAGCIASFFFVSGNATFVAASLFTGATLWILLLVQLVLAQQLFNPARMGQISSANTLVQSIAIGLIIIPATGWFLDVMKGTVMHLPVPFIGDLPIGPYRFVYLILAAIYACSLFGIVRVRHYWQLLGGPDHYVPPALQPEAETVRT
ncbi:MAG TPA: MFS transporter, partial [Verrucomicrobiae bacterium]|nr:MFS transporter [Verrucomicrobiae bacterium]